MFRVPSVLDEERTIYGACHRFEFADDAAQAARLLPRAGGEPGSPLPNAACRSS